MTKKELESTEFICNTKNIEDSDKCGKRLSKINVAQRDGVKAFHKITMNDGRKGYILINDGQDKRLNMPRLAYRYSTIDFLLPAQHKNTFHIYTLEIAYHHTILEGEERDAVVQKTWLNNRPDLKADDFRFVEITAKSIDECNIYHGKDKVLVLDDIDGYGLSRSARKHGLSKDSALYMMLRSIPEFQPMRKAYFDVLVNQKEQPLVKKISDTIHRKMHTTERGERE